MLWQLMTVMSSVSLLVGAVTPLMDNSVVNTPTNWALALCVGLPLGAVNFVVMMRIPGVATRLLMSCTERTREMWLRLLYLVAVIWGLLVMTLADLVSRLVL